MMKPTPTPKPASLKALCFAAGFCASAMTSQAALVAHYKFDEDAGATVAANQLAGSSGTIGASVVTGVAGVSGSAYQLPNLSTDAGIVDMGNATFFSAITTSQAVTLSAWVKTTDTNNGRNVVIYAGSDSVTNSYIDLGVSGQTPNIGAANGRLRPAGNTGITEIFSTPTLVNDDQWRHLALTIDLLADNITLYVNGTQVATNALANEAFPNFNNFEIGRLGRFNSPNFAPTDAFGGLIDDVQVYDQALNASQVEFLFSNPGMAVPEPGSLALAGFGLLALARRRRA